MKVAVCLIFTTCVLFLVSRETAYIYAISSAGIMFSVTRACAKGELDNCGCDGKSAHRDTGADFEWGGCSDNIRHGARFSKEFLDSDEIKNKDHGSMNLWNNAAGRKVTLMISAVVCMHM